MKKRLIGLFLLIIMGCKGGSSQLDGTWRLTKLTCNGQPGSKSAGGAAQWTAAGNEQIVHITGNAIRVRFIQPGCEFFVDANFTLINNVLSTGYYNPFQCIPALCSGACGVSLNTTINARVSMVGISTFALTQIDSTETTCSGATPAESTPTMSTFVRE